ncbi:tetratricopeptide repeat protein [Helicobacter pylori]|uniref:tetratricopeptide repeat protein n=1 Tax=Helicobacter pylori TaxID=210 RepID=UPI001E5C7985|nr:tetratricopeptide repeat protein [Helicobacter pylori]
MAGEPNLEELFNLGMLSYDKQDFSKARKYFEKACELNSGGGYAALGDLYYDGEGVEKNLIKATQFYSKACKLGYQLACEMLKELR